jgi:hypothetical protein
MRLTLSRKKRGAFGGRSGLSLFSRGKHAFTEIQAFPLPQPPLRENPSWRTSMVKWRRSSQSCFKAHFFAGEDLECTPDAYVPPGGLA